MREKPKPTIDWSGTIALAIIGLTIVAVVWIIFE